MEPVEGNHNGVFEGQGSAEPRPDQRVVRLLERSDVAFYRVRLRPDFRVEALSSTVARLTGYSREQFAAEPQLIWRVVHPDERRRLQLLLADPTQAATPSTVRLLHRDGRISFAEHLAMVTANDSGVPAYVEGIVRDVSALRAPHHLGDRRAAPTDDLPVTVYLADASGFTYVSPSVEALTGFHADEWVRHPTLWAERLHPDDRARVLFLATAGAAGQAWQAEYRWLAKDGGIVPLRQASAPVRDEHGGLVCLHGMLLGGTPPREAPGASVAAQRMDAIARLAGVVAHDFNNLLTVILGHAEMLLDTFREPGLAHDSAVEIKNAGDAGARIARQLLAASGRQSLTLQTLDLNEAIRDAADTLHELAGGELEVRFDLGSGLPRVECDLRQLQRVLRILVVDARDAMPSGGRLTFATRAVYQGDRREVVLMASDSRPRPAHDASLSPFEPFIVSKKSPRGAGLNRTAVYGIVTQMGGRISMDAAPEGGLVVTIGLPAKGNDAAMGQ